MGWLGGNFVAATAKPDEFKAAGGESWEGLVADVDKVRSAFVRSLHCSTSQV